MSRARLRFKKVVEAVGPETLALADLLDERDVILGSLPGPKAKDGPVLVFESDAWLDMRRGATSDLRREQVGVLYGRACNDRGQPWLWISHAFHARSARGSAIHVDLDADAWQDIHDQARASGIDGEAVVVGWWHTHPDLGAFFSGTDRATQERAFPQPWQIGIVIDPVRRETALFRGGDSADVALRPVVVESPAPKRPDVPANAVAIDLPPDSPDLSEAAWNALVAANGDVLLRPVPHPVEDGRCALVFDRPALKRRHPHAAPALASSSLGRKGWRAPLTLGPKDVACVLVHGRFRPTRELLPRSIT